MASGYAKNCGWCLMIEWLTIAIGMLWAAFVALLAASCWSEAIIVLPGLAAACYALEEQHRRQGGHVAKEGAERL